MDTSFDGILGAYWFGDKRWRFDYAEGKLYRVDSIYWPALPASHTVELGFMTDSSGQVLTHFPRLDIVVDGDTIPTLPDTGAKLSLSDDAANIMGQEGEVGGSFIISTLFDRWRLHHPDWRVIEGGDAHLEMDLIEVPEVTIANHTVGPVWFARRPDQNFTEYMSQWMDHPVDWPLFGGVDFLGITGDETFMIKAMPTTIVVDQKSQIRYKQSGTILPGASGEAFMKLLTKVLEEE